MLVVDDNIDAVQTATVFLELAGHEVKAVTDATQALAIAPVFLPDVIVLDIGPGPSLLGTETAVPFPVNVTISGSGLTPTISWTVPNNFVADAVRINIFDRGVILANGQADNTHSVQVDPNAGSYTIPAVLSSG